LAPLGSLRKKQKWIVSIWVVESNNITASNPENNGEMFEPAADKVYRHPTFYDLPDEVKHM